MALIFKMNKLKAVKRNEKELNCHEKIEKNKDLADFRPFYLLSIKISNHLNLGMLKRAKQQKLYEKKEQVNRQSNCKTYKYITEAVHKISNNSQKV